MIRICVAGLIGYETAAGLYEMDPDTVKNHFSASYIKAFEKLSGLVSSPEDLKGVDPSEILYAGEIKEGGLYAALWEACEKMSGKEEEKKAPEEHGRRPVGCRVFPDQIPIRQEVVEFCELFETDPYEAPSRGAWVVLLEDAAWIRCQDRQREDSGSGALLTAVGYLTDDRCRLLVREGLERYLTPLVRQYKDMENRRQSHDRQHDPDEK